MQTDRLFETQNPLEERLGKAFFDELPPEPGVYRFYDGNGELLYVGKAGNLRRRLFSYRRIKADERSRKLRRLVRLIQEIRFDIADSEEEALITENRLIRERKPEFNSARKTPENYYYLTIKITESIVESNLRMHLREEDLSITYGAFKGHRLVRKATGGFLRLLSIITGEIDTPFKIPFLLLRKLTPMNYKMELPRDIFPDRMMFSDAVDRFFRGESDQMLYLIMEYIHRRDLLDGFTGRYILHDMESLGLFFKHKARKNYEIRTAFNRPSHLVLQHDLDDLIVKLAFK